MSDVKDEKLVKQALAGEQQAFAALVEKYYRMVYSLGFARLKDADAAEDLVQEVFLRVHLNLEKIRKPAQFSSWLTGITRNVAIDWQKRDQKRSELIRSMPELESAMPEDATKGARERLQHEEEAERVHGAIMDLPVEQREVVLLHYVEGMTKRDIASQLGVHPSTIGRQIEKSLASMRGLLEPVLQERASLFRASANVASKTLAVVAASASLSVANKASLASAASVKTAWALRLLRPMVSTIIKGGVAVGVGKKIAIIAVTVAVLGGGGAVYLAEKEVFVFSAKHRIARMLDRIDARMEELQRAGRRDRPSKGKAFNQINEYCDDLLGKNGKPAPSQEDWGARSKAHLERIEFYLGKMENEAEKCRDICGSPRFTSPAAKEEELMYWWFDLEKYYIRLCEETGRKKVLPLSPEEEAEVRQMFADYRQDCGEMNIDAIVERSDWEGHRIFVTGLVGTYDIEKEKGDARRHWSESRERYEMIADVELESVEIDTSKAGSIKKDHDIDIPGTMVLLKGGDWEWYFRDTDEGWKCFSQEVSGRSCKLLDEIREQQKNE